ncbi:FCS-Like Zinc finger 17-like [Typha latifolia]|uniref:FCS-Like Zinc finger 17-like n=1 Tax=Typha latifolia TaxID=4733 RepID=UPI003C304392
MLPRARSIFHIGEDYGESIRVVSSSMPAPENLVGLQLLIQQPQRRPAPVVVKASMRLRKGFPELGFLKACSLCHKVLGPQMDVFMYKGEKGFCSVECRCHQILLDERRDLGIFSANERLRLPHYYYCQHHHLRGSTIGASDHRRKIAAAR